MPLVVQAMIHRAWLGWKGADSVRNVMSVQHDGYDYDMSLEYKECPVITVTERFNSNRRMGLKGQLSDLALKLSEANRLRDVHQVELDKGEAYTKELESAQESKMDDERKRSLEQALAGWKKASGHYREQVARFVKEAKEIQAKMDAITAIDTSHKASWTVSLDSL